MIPNFLKIVIHFKDKNIFFEVKKYSTFEAYNFYFGKVDNRFFLSQKSFFMIVNIHISFHIEENVRKNSSKIKFSTYEAHNFFSKPIFFDSEHFMIFLN